MESFLKTLLFGHIAAGFVGFLAGILSLISKKGQTRHKLAGSLFYISMTLVCLSAFTLGILKDLYFFILVAVFSFYNILAGKRALMLKKSEVSFLDYIIHGTALIFMLLFLVFAVYIFRKNTTLGILSGAFGLGGLLNIKTYAGTIWKQDHSYLMRVHIGGMVGGFIAALTAFSVQSFYFLPDLWRWLWPTLVLTPVIAYWQRKFTGLKAVKSNLADSTRIN